MAPETELALVGVSGSGITLLLTEAFRRFKGRHERRKTTAEIKVLEAEGDARILGAATAAFTALTERMDAELSDLRERVRRCEDEMLVLRSEKAYLVQERDRLLDENQRLRDRVDLLAGELRQVKQLSESTHRVYGQEDEDDDILPA